MAHQVRSELAAAQEAITGLPETIEKARRSRAGSRRRPLLIAGIGVTVLAGGAVAFAIVRRSTQPEPSPLPPSVDVTPRP